ncbi:MAG: metallophosphoesterase, partial [Gammaproteobacteria bacterium]|nr:metallophosphoesterase [Gammaproteobacteria bacterium]
VIALSTAHPSPVFLATGSAGHRQIATLESMLETARHENLFRIVMLHHPPTSENVSWRRRLIDGEALRAALKRHGAELVLHGHVHKRVYTTIRNAGGAIPVFGVPSASARGTVRAKRAGYNICEITATSTAWTLRVEERALSGTGPGLECIAEHHFNIPIPRPATTTLQQAAIVTPARTAVPL